MKVIVAAARPRFPFIRFWSDRRIGHVATTIVVAHKIEGRKGRRTHPTAPMSMRIKRI
jgi:hypothetical protein